MSVSFNKNGVVMASGITVGENLFKDSNWSITSGSSVHSGGISTAVPAGTTVTVSVQIDANDVAWDASATQRRLGVETNLARTDTSGTQYIGVWAGEVLSTGANIVQAFTGSFHGRVSKTFTTLGDLTIWRNVGIYVQGVSSGTVRVSNPKLEIGSVATPWIPSTADYDVVPDLHGFAEEDNLMKVYEDYITTHDFIEY